MSNNVPRRVTRRRAAQSLAAAGLAAAVPGLGLGSAFAAEPAASAATPAGLKVLRYAFEVAETSLDPAKINDLYSRILTPHIFEGLYTYDHLARPVKIKPRTATALPEHSDDFRVWTVHVRPGIFFADDPVFKGKKRELVAQDYVYAWKRFADPANKSPVWSGMDNDGYIGLPELRQQGIDAKKPFDYDQEIEGIRAIDRYTIRFTLSESRPRFVETLAGGDLYGAVAREVIEFYGSEAEAHPVGTGPFKLAQWRRSSLIVFERNPDFREMFYDAEPAADDVEGQALLARFKGRRLPMVDRVEISIIEEEQPRWLSFINGEADVAYRVGYQFAPQAMPNGKVAPNLAKKGIRGYPVSEAAANFYLFNMDDPIIGGYTPAQVALRRAFSLGLDSQSIINYAYSGLGTVAQGPTLPNTTGYDPKLKTECGEYDPARAKALLDIVRLPRPRWRRLARAARWLAAAAARADAVAAARPQDLRGDDEEHEDARHPRRDERQAVAREPEVGARGQVPDVVARPVGLGAGFGRFVPAVRQPTDRRPEHVAHPLAGARRAVRQAADAARRSGARGRAAPGGAPGRRLHAAEVVHQPHLDRHGPVVRRRLPAHDLLERLVAVRRHRSVAAQGVIGAKRGPTSWR